MALRMFECSVVAHATNIRYLSILETIRTLQDSYRKINKAEDAKIASLKEQLEEVRRISRLVESTKCCDSMVMGDCVLLTHDDFELLGL